MKHIREDEIFLLDWAEEICH